MQKSSIVDVRQGSKLVSACNLTVVLLKHLPAPVAFPVESFISKISDFVRFQREGDHITEKSLFLWNILELLSWNNSYMSNQESYINPVDTGRKLNINKTFRRRAGLLLNVLCTFNLRPVLRGKLKITCSISFTVTTNEIFYNNNYL